MTGGNTGCLRLYTHCPPAYLLPTAATSVRPFSWILPLVLPVYEHVQGKLPVILHMGDKRFDYSHPARLRRVLDMFPKLQVIAAHFGAYQIHEQAYEQLKDKDCFFDVSSSLMFMEEGMAENYVNQYGA